MMVPDKTNMIAYILGKVSEFFPEGLVEPIIDARILKMTVTTYTTKKLKRNLKKSLWSCHGGCFRELPVGLAMAVSSSALVGGVACFGSLLSPRGAA